MAALLLAAGAVAMTSAGNSPANQPAINAILDTYRVAKAPSISPAEAQWAVASARDLSTAFRVSSEKVIPSVVTIENSPKAVAVKRRLRLAQSQSVERGAV